MATTVDEIKAKFPLPIWKFQVQIGGESYAFSEVSGLAIEYETITYRDGLGPVHMPGMDTPVDLTLKRGIVKGDSFLMDWLTSIKMNTVNKQDITISLMDEEQKNPVVVWTVINAFPKKIEAPTFDATSNEVAIETLELMADDLKIEYQK
jgi:phage tail-like protein